ncbi:MAG: radical SAM protein [Nanoarchaeota archaeon]|nr:radical SAM protein [Nanoarchaeota archaeon]
MKAVINQVVFQITKKCDQSCPHCFFNSSPIARKKLTLTQIKNALNDLKKSRIKKINKFVISGGEPVIHPNIISIVKKIRVAFPFSKIRIDTNGLFLFENPSLFKLLKADIYDISVDIFHNQGILRKKEKFKEIFIKKDGSSDLVNFFLEQKIKYRFELNIRWTSNREDNNLFENFFKKYRNKGVNILKKDVTATGRANMLLNKVKGNGYLIKEKPSNFKCLLGDSLLLAVNGFWYGCYHPVSFTKLSLPGQSLIFNSKLENLLNSNLGKKLPEDGIIDVLRLIKRKNSKSRIVVKNIMETRYWYRCQPCEDACKKNIFNINNNLFI